MSEGPDPAEYCRQVESYLCRKNDGHLIRVVGPAFEKVSAWAAQGVPLPVAFRGIDRYCERYYAKGPRRRPVRIEFCEADVLELFDAWRRAVGVAATGSQDAPERTRKPALGGHIARAIERLVALRAGQVPDGLATPVELAVRDLDLLHAEASQARGERRAAIVQRLEEIDRRLMEAAAAALPEDRAAALVHEAETELAPFAARMPAEARAASHQAALLRLVREALRLPTIRFD